MQDVHKNMVTSFIFWAAAGHRNFLDESGKCPEAPSNPKVHQTRGLCG
jgi:hypothetical protein